MHTHNLSMITGPVKLPIDILADYKNQSIGDPRYAIFHDYKRFSLHLTITNMSVKVYGTNSERGTLIDITSTYSSVNPIATHTIISQNIDCPYEYVKIQWTPAGVHNSILAVLKNIEDDD